MRRPDPERRHAHGSRAAARVCVRLALVLAVLAPVGIARAIPDEASVAIAAPKTANDPPVSASRTDATGGAVSSTVRSGRSAAVLVRWVGTLEVTALAVFAVLFPLMGSAGDRGYALAKLLAWLAPGYLAALACALGIAPNSAATAWIATGTLWVGGGIAAWRGRRSLLAFARHRVGDWLPVQAVFWIGFGLPHSGRTEPASHPAKASR